MHIHIYIYIVEDTPDVRELFTSDFTSDDIFICKHLASALAAAHTVGVVHQNIKPENIMVRPDGYVEVLDWTVCQLNSLHLLPQAMATLQRKIISQPNEQIFMSGQTPPALPQRKPPSD